MDLIELVKRQQLQPFRLALAKSLKFARFVVRYIPVRKFIVLTYFNAKHIIAPTMDRILNIVLSKRVNNLFLHTSTHTVSDTY